MDIAITKMSSKGQIVLPAEMRKDVKEGEKLLIIQHKNGWLLKKANEMNLQLQKELQIAKDTDRILNNLEVGKGTTMDSDKFMQEIEKW